MTDSSQVARFLEERLNEFTARSGEIEDRLHHPLVAESSEQAVDLAVDEALAGAADDDVISREICQFRAALGRIEHRSY